MKSGIQEASDTVGGQVLLAEALGVSQQAVSLWVGRGYAPLDRIPRIAELTGVEPRRLCDPHILDVIDPEEPTPCHGAGRSSVWGRNDGIWGNAR